MEVHFPTITERLESQKKAAQRTRGWRAVKQAVFFLTLGTIVSVCVAGGFIALTG